ncbi:MAG: Wzz/FepE/Etk N-terminal domain-containing protein [Ruthenibacterium sp.]
MEQEYETIDLRELFGIVRGHLLMILAVAVLFATIGGLFTAFLITPQYEANATMIVNTRQDQTAVVTNDQLTSAKNLVSTYGIIVRSDMVLNKVIAALGLPMNYQELGAKVTVSAVDATQVMQITVVDPDPALAKSIVKEITTVAPDIIKDTVEAGSVKVISEARAGENPVSPNLPMNIAVSFMLGLVVTIGIVLLKEMLNNTFKTEADITKNLHIPVLGVIPRVEGK